MVQAPTKPLTLDQFLQLPETKPASEYMDGQIHQKPMPQGEHSLIQGSCITTVNLVVQPVKIALAFPELRCTFGGRSIVPDIAVFEWHRIPRKPDGTVANRFEIAPDWTIEILSADQRPTKVMRNILHCLSHGTQMGWMIDPEEHGIFIYTGNKTDFLEDPQQPLPVPEFAQALTLTVGQIFEWLLASSNPYLSRL